MIFKGKLGMRIDTEAVMNEVIDKMRDILKIRTNDFPNIDLYMDQVTTFMDEKLRYTVRLNADDEKILTKTMINNYAKNDLLPPPYKKKYSKEHMMVLIFVYYFKNFLTISDICTLLNPLTESYFENNDGMKVEDVYEEIFGLGEERLDYLEEDLKNKFRVVEDSFKDVPQEEAEYLRLFSLICLLSYDIFVKKMLIERFLDEMTAKKSAEDEVKKEDDKKKEKKRTREKKNTGNNKE